jgi:regulatory protein
LSGQLTKRGYPDDIRDRVLDRLAAAGLVDDTDFAEEWVRSRRAKAGKSKRALAAELQTKGVDNDLITRALDGLGADAERERAEQLVRARLRREALGGDSKEEVRVSRRLAAMLARRGYSQTLVAEVVVAELAAERERRRV